MEPKVTIGCKNEPTGGADGGPWARKWSHGVPKWRHCDTWDAQINSFSKIQYIQIRRCLSSTPKAAKLHVLEAHLRLNQ
jgi:hypothetical protein